MKPVSLQWNQIRGSLTERTSSTQAGPWTVQWAASSVAWLMASLLPSQPVAVKVTELQDRPTELLYLGLQGHFLRGTAKAAPETDGNLACNTETQQSTKHRILQIVSTRGHLSVKHSKKRNIEVEYEDFWHINMYKKRINSGGRWSIPPPTADLEDGRKILQVQEEGNTTGAFHFIYKILNLVHVKLLIGVNCTLKMVLKNLSFTEG